MAPAGAGRVDLPARGAVHRRRVRHRACHAHLHPGASALRQRRPVWSPCRLWRCSPVLAAGRGAWGQTDEPKVVVQDLGRRGYAEVLELQRTLCRRRMEARSARTCCSWWNMSQWSPWDEAAGAPSLPLPPAELERRGIGGLRGRARRGRHLSRAGQLVGYPILDLRAAPGGLHWYLRHLEAALIGALDSLGIEAGRNPGLTGVWTGGARSRASDPREAVGDLPRICSQREYRSGLFRSHRALRHPGRGHDQCGAGAGSNRRCGHLEGRPVRRWWMRWEGPSTWCR